MKNKERIDRLEAEARKLEKENTSRHVENEFNVIQLPICTWEGLPCDYGGSFVPGTGRICTTKCPCEDREIHRFRHLGY